jgi:uncharacterized protein
VQVELRPERALYWPEAKLLAVADLHWGKPERFQQHGIPLPSGVLADDLKRLSAALQATGARRLLLVGDLVHSPHSLTPEVVEQVASWRAAHAPVDMVLVRGNHERHLAALPPAWHMQVMESHLDEGPLRFAHEPTPAAGRYVWSGHLHPVVKLAEGKQRLRLPCFYVGSQVGVLPAFSAFTGGVEVHPRAGERLFVVAEGAVVEVPPLASRPRRR